MIVFKNWTYTVLGRWLFRKTRLLISYWKSWVFKEKDCSVDISK